MRERSQELCLLVVLTPPSWPWLQMPLRGSVHSPSQCEAYRPAVKAVWLGAAVDPTKLAEQEVEKAEV